jgi:Carboxypeptidase regulatory-like domain
MRSILFAALVSCASLLAASTAWAQVPGSYAAASGPAGGPVTPVAPSATTAPDVPATVILTGHVKSATGPLPGAVVKIAGSNEMVVTDADGSFHVSVPVNTAVKATASYAGFADENVALDDAAADSEVSMNTAQIIKVGKHQQLKTYLKTARKQNKKTLRRVRR